MKFGLDRMKLRYSSTKSATIWLDAGSRLKKINDEIFLWWSSLTVPKFALNERNNIIKSIPIYYLHTPADTGHGQWKIFGLERNVQCFWLLWLFLLVNAETDARQNFTETSLLQVDKKSPSFVQPYVYFFAYTLHWQKSQKSCEIVTDWYLIKWGDVKIVFDIITQQIMKQKFRSFQDEKTKTVNFSFMIQYQLIIYTNSPWYFVDGHVWEWDEEQVVDVREAGLCFQQGMMIGQYSLHRVKYTYKQVFQQA